MEMNLMENNTNEDLLNGFIDGELDYHQEETLFERLSLDGELRAELHDTRLFRSTAQAYALTLIPPASLTKDTFNKIGFIYPPIQLPVSEFSTILSGTGAFLRRFWLSVLFFFLILGSASIFFISHNNDIASTAGPVVREDLQSGKNNMQGGSYANSTQNNPSSSSSSVEKSPSSKNISSSNGSSAAVKSPSPENAGASQHTQRIRNRPTADVNHELPKQTNAITEQSSPAQLRSQDLMDISVASIPTSQSIPVLADPSEISVNQILIRPMFGFILPPNFMAEYRAFSGRSNPAATIQSGSDPWFQSMMAAVYYSPWENHWFGIAFGQEPFAQHFSGTDNNISVRYEQNLMSGWIAASYQYRFAAFHLGGVIEPFITASAGSTFQWWPLLRGTVGISYRPIRNISFIIGADGSLLAYPFQSTWFTTNKIGMTYGISLQF